jgi:hypothetical protein
MQRVRTALTRVARPIHRSTTTIPTLPLPGLPHALTRPSLLLTRPVPTAIMTRRICSTSLASTRLCTHATSIRTRHRNTTRVTSSPPPCHLADSAVHVRFLHTPWYPPTPPDVVLRFPTVSVAIAYALHLSKHLDHEVAEWEARGSPRTESSTFDKELSNASTCKTLLERYFSRMSATAALKAVDAINAAGVTTGALEQIAKDRWTFASHGDHAAELIQLQIRLYELELRFMENAAERDARTQQVTLLRARAATLKQLGDHAKLAIHVSGGLPRIGLSDLWKSIVELGFEMLWAIVTRLLFAGAILAGLWYFTRP